MHIYVNVCNSFLLILVSKLTQKKTEFLCLGLKKPEAFSHDFKTTLKILGVYFGYSEQSRYKENFEEVLKSIKISLNMWKGRGLTLIGKIQIVKSFAIPKFMSKAALIHVSKDLLRAVIQNYIISSGMVRTRLSVQP